ncbi:MAG: 2-dehydropantoate 2-reductase [Clostridiales bacterium]|jgi:2-dehydropantoate 2-reductase|nr:2-dehydropantoate 2-reductase [Clostridiales bacterium]
MRAAIYGAGAIGTVLGAYITGAGGKIELISRNKAHIDALKNHGARIVGTAELTVPVTALTPDEMSGKYDIIFLVTKQLDNAAVVRGLAAYLSEDGVICTLQNGLPELSVAEIIGADRTYGCAIAWGASLIEPGVCELTSEPTALTFGLGALNGGKNTKTEQIAALLGLMGRVETEKNFIGARWAKLLVNSAFSGLSAVFGETFGEVASDGRSRLIAQKLIKECIDVAAKAGIKIEPIQGKDAVKLLDYKNPIKQKISFCVIPLAIKKHKNLRASMLQDLERGKKCEVDAINGAVSEYGKRYGCPTPYNDKVVEIIKGIEAGKYKPSRENLALFDLR